MDRAQESGAIKEVITRTKEKSLTFGKRLSSRFFIVVTSNNKEEKKENKELKNKTVARDDGIS